MLAEPEIMNKLVVSKLYPYVASKHSTEPNRVERAIRHMITTLPFNKNQALKNLFPTRSSDAHNYTNKHFIAVLVERLRNEG